MNSAAPPNQSRPPSLLRFLRPPPAPPPITDPAEIRSRYAFFRPRILLWTTVGYGMFYFVRKNLSVAMPVMGQQLGISKASLGLFLTLHGVLYGVSKFINGILCDRADARIFMAIGLAASALLNICFGFSTGVIALGVIWMLNGWFQGMGYPPCARLLTHWFRPKELATKMAIWNSSHTLGALTIVLLCGYLVAWFHDWRICFFVPAALAIATSVVLFTQLRDAPESVGLPEVEGTQLGVPLLSSHRVPLLSSRRSAVAGSGDGEVASDGRGSPAPRNAEPENIRHPTSDIRHSPAPILDYASAPGLPVSYRAFLYQRVFSDKYIWIVSAANFFVYILRYSVFDWGPTMLKEFKGLELSSATWLIAAFELSGFAGVMFTGWLTDRHFRGRAAPLALLSMLLAGVTMFLFWKTPGHRTFANTALLAAAGFFIYGPQALVAVIVANRATKRAAATAVGLTSIFGYASTVVSGYGLGVLVQHYGWSAVFACLIATAALGALLFAAALPAKTHGYADA